MPKTDRWLLLTDRQIPSRSSPVMIESNSIFFGRTWRWIVDVRELKITASLINNRSQLSVCGIHIMLAHTISSIEGNWHTSLFPWSVAQENPNLHLACWCVGWISWMVTHCGGSLQYRTRHILTSSKSSYDIVRSEECLRSATKFRACLFERLHCYRVALKIPLRTACWLRRIHLEDR